MKQMPHLKIWKRILTQRRGTTQAAILIARIQLRYLHLLSDQPHVTQRALRSQLETLILPGLALYQTLRDESKDNQAALAEVEPMFKAAFFARLRRNITVLNHLADPFPVVRPALRRMTSTAYQPGACEVVEDSSECFAVNIYRCFILDTLKAYGAAELTTLYCKTDDWLAETLPKVRWLRTKTLGRGDDLCDFRWCRSSQERA